MNTAIAVVGRLHNLVLHFPIALVFAVAFLEIVMRRRMPLDQRRPAVLALLGLAASFAVVTAATGLAHFADEGFRGEALIKATQHRNVGIASAVLLVGAAFAYWRAPAKVSLPLIVLATLGVSLAGHAGGTLVKGSNYLFEPFEPKGAGPADDDDDGPAVASDGDEAEAKARERHPEGAVPDKPEYAKHIKPLFERSCTKCHGPEKRKSGLRLDKKRFAMKGGETGPAVVPGNLGESLVVKYIMLPPEDEDVMPPKGKLLAQSEIDTLRKWIEQGAEWPDDPQ